MNLRIFVVVILFFLNASVSAETPPRQNECTSQNWGALKKHLADKNISPKWRDACGDSIAVLHLYYGSSETAYNYIQDEIKLKTPPRKLEAVFYAALRGNFQKITKLLLDYGVSANANENMGYSPLMVAAGDGNLEIMRILIRAGANVNYKSSNYDALTVAIENGHSFGVSLLLESSADIEQYRNNEKEVWLLSVAIKSGNYRLVDLLMNNGFRLNAIDANGNTPLYRAIENQSPYNMIDFLLQKGADPCLESATGENSIRLYDRLRNASTFNPYGTSNYGSLLDGRCQ